MSSDKLPESFDVVICGTGLVESMVAAALSRIDKKVLHIDRNDYYGSQWATFNFEGIVDYLAGNVKDKELHAIDGLTIPQTDSDISNIIVKSYILEKVVEPMSLIGDNNGNKDKLSGGATDNQDVVEKNIQMKASESDSDTFLSNQTENPHQQISNENKCCVSAKENLIEKKPSTIVSQAKIQQKSPDISLEDLQTLSRKFNFDISPKFLFSAGPLVQAVIKANISHYMEFKLVDRILTIKNDTIVELPCNRSDVFTSNFLSMIEKRMLMKFLTFCLDNLNLESEEVKPYLSEPFPAFLQSRRLSDNLQKFIVYSIAMVKPDTTTEIAIVKTQTFLQSLGRFGKSPFIWPLFGIGEIPQAFCRMCAVFGGLYCLRKVLKSLTVDSESNKCTEIVTDAETVQFSHAVFNINYIPTKFKANGNNTYVSKAILITNGSISPSSEEHLSFLTIPPIDGKSEIVKVIEIGPASCACPTGLFVLYLTCHSTDTAQKDLEDYVFKLVTTDKSDKEKPFLLWSVYFNQLDKIDTINLPVNLFVTSSPGPSLGFDNAVEEAEIIFKTICPDGEFLLTVPNPEDIKWDYSEQTVYSESPADDQEHLKKNIVEETSEASNVDLKTSNFGNDDKGVDFNVSAKTDNQVL